MPLPFDRPRSLAEPHAVARGIVGAAPVVVVTLLGEGVQAYVSDHRSPDGVLNLTLPDGPVATALRRADDDLAVLVQAYWVASTARLRAEVRRPRLRAEVRLAGWLAAQPDLRGGVGARLHLAEATLVDAHGVCELDPEHYAAAVPVSLRDDSVPA